MTRTNEKVKKMLDQRTQDTVREAAGLIGRLFIIRRDVKAVYRADHAGRWHWTAVREKYTMGDFANHLTGKECLGAYLLSPASMCKFLAFDIDVAKIGKFWPIHDTGNPAEFEVRLDLEEGPLEAILHDVTSDARPWVRIILMEAIRDIADQVRAQLGLTDILTIITGGGAHVLVPLPGLNPALDVRSAGIEVVAHIAAATRRTDVFFDYGSLGELSIEIFPKQDRLDESGLGNLIRLPFGWHHEAGIRTFAIDPADEPHPIWNFRKIGSLDALRRLVQTVS